MQEIKRAFRLTHIDNIANILQVGIVHRDSPLSNPDYVSIGDSSLIEKRKKIELENGKTLGDYIPFYFGCRMPMLYNIQNGYGVPRREAEEIVYVVVNISDIISHHLPCLFTDGHARSSFSTFYDAAELHRVNEIVRAEDVFAQWWNLDSEPI